MADDLMQQARALELRWRSIANELRHQALSMAAPSAIIRAAQEYDDRADELAAILATPSESASVGEDAARYRWLKQRRPVLLLTGFFGNGCSNRTLDEVDAAIDAARALPGDGKEG